MGNCCQSIVIDENDVEYNTYKISIDDELKSYLEHIHNLKTILATNSSNNKTTIQLFYLIPRFWFEEWERRVEILFEKNRIINFNTELSFENENKLYKFFYELIPENLWIQFARNKLYNFDQNKRKENRVIICNNILIIYKKNNIEIFYYEKEDDIFFTNLFFDFGNNNDQCDNFLKLLRKSPIQEILGNNYYNKNISKFNLPKYNTVIYNKTRKINERIKTFFKKEYEKYFGVNTSSSKNVRIRNCKTENKNIITDNDPNENICRLKTIADPRDNIQIKNPCSFDKRNLCTNDKINDLNYNNNKDDNNKNNDVLSLKQNTENIKNDNLFLKRFNGNKNSNNLAEKISSLETIPNIFNSGIEIFNYKKFFISFIYCLFYIKNLTDYFLKEFEYGEAKKSRNEEQILCNEYHKIVQYLDKNRTSIIDNECTDINFEQIDEIILKTNSNNFISELIDIMHYELKIEIEDELKKENDIKHNIEIKINKNNQNDQNKRNISYDKLQKKDNLQNINTHASTVGNIAIYNNNQSYETFLCYFNDNYDSLLGKLFFGIKEISFICQKCQNIQKNYEAINVIDLYINNLVDFFNDKNKNLFTLSECLDSYKRVHFIDDNTIYCKKCKKPTNYNIINSIIKLPEIAIFYFHYNSKIDRINDKIKIEYEELLKIFDMKYKLKNIVSHTASSGVNGEYIKYMTYCKNDDENQWYIYTEEKVEIFDFKKNKNNIQSPFILMYEIIKG